MITHLWHTILGMPKQDEAWHRQDVADEMDELKEARGFFARWSELSDVAYTVTRAWWSGHESIKWPWSRRRRWWGSLYMFPKYTLRWLFFWILGKRFDRRLGMTEVRNPAKVHKLHEIAERNGIDPVNFERAAKRLLRFWPLLK
ncbi:MAG: hypothetical protein ABIA47_04805 [bacterium]